MGRGMFSVSDSGRIVYRPEARTPSQLTWLDRNGRGVKTLGEPGVFFNVDLSPDGKRVAISRLTQQAGDKADFDIGVMDVATGRMTRLTDDPAWEFDPAWSPDGDRIVFNSNRPDPSTSSGRCTRERRTAAARTWPWSRLMAHPFCCRLVVYEHPCLRRRLVWFERYLDPLHEGIRRANAIHTVESGGGPPGVLARRTLGGLSLERFRSISSLRSSISSGGTGLSRLSKRRRISTLERRWQRTLLRVTRRIDDGVEQ